MRILVTDNLLPKGIEILKEANFQVDSGERLQALELQDLIGNYDALIVRSGTKVTVEILEKIKNLKVIGRAGVGMDNIDVEAATARGIVVMNTPGSSSITTAEHTFALMLALAKNVPQADSSLKASRWEKGRFVSVELSGKTLGIVGLGRIGMEVAKLARGFLMKVIAYDPFISPEVVSSLGVELVDFAELLNRSEFISLHTPLTPETYRMINRESITLMRDGVRIINCARGGIVDEEALYEAMQSGKVAGAAFDVFEEEPCLQSPLFRLENFIGTPHLGAASEEAQESVSMEIAQQIVDYLTKGIIRNAVNAPSIEPELLKKLQPFLTLAEKLGRLVSQLSEGRMEHIRIEYRGEIATYDLRPLAAAVVKGVMDPIREGINYVNALPLAKASGLRVIESKSTEEADYASLITVGIKTDRDIRVVAGTLFGRRDLRVVRIDEFPLEAVPEGYLLVFSNLDVPGVIGRIGTLIGQNQVNIAGMHLGRERPGGRAVSVVNVDQLVPPHVLEEIRRMPNIVYAKLVKV